MAGTGNMYIWEFAGAPTPASAAMPKVMDVNAQVTTQVVDYSAGVAASAAFNANTSHIRLMVDKNANVLFGSAPTAVIDDSPYHIADTEYFYKVVPGDKVSAIKATS